ncbi:S-layer homology domain-containing protein [Herbivorax sp. ANBcel31]|uniref:S-layer homology domain-containing protein n=1 Tax=Herbivorax sp. ANBcel31 TaxID=3069754 RepID=UPI0027B1A47C|nr:S-layer homology domain-containing protein [Herbivorax sp. ANBcel31]MDQ2084855.1 S-layer homology domain-containing protein [Herbivorax sp. ANBcel31]
MRTKVFVVFFMFVFFMSNLVVTSSGGDRDENIEIITPVSVMERAPYYEGQKLTVVFSIKNKEEEPIYIDSIMAAVVNGEEQYSNSQWFRTVAINPDSSYHFKGDITFDESGKYSVFICYKRQDGKWIKFDEQSSTFEIEINSKSDSENMKPKALPNAYKGSQYGPINIFSNDNNEKINLDGKVLPEGLDFSKDGYISGIPTKAGEFIFEITELKKTYKIKVEENTDSLFEEVVIKKDEVLFPTAQAIEFSDIKNHWAKDIIMRMYSLGIIKGFPDGMFYPDEPVTRAELSAMVFNALNFSLDEDFTSDFIDIEKHWANDFISQISNHFIFIEDEVFNPDIPANREETVAVIASAAGLNHSYVNPAIVDCVFEDSASISHSLKELIAQCYLNGIVRGYEDGSFNPSSNVTRAEVCTIIENILANGVSSDILSSRPFDNQDYLIEANSFDSFLAQNYSDSDEDYLMPATRGGSSSRFDERKLREMRLEYIFGKNDDGTYNTYSTKEEADAHMVKIDIKVWDFDSSTGEKITKTLDLTVNEKIADETLEIFNLIYEHEERFPINSVVGYDWRPPYGSNNRISEHNYGTAIDINWADNPHVLNGVAVTQGRWEPGVNPYSIPPDGSVVQIFKAYQWAWGGDAWGSHNRDYMHFSFLGN